MLTRQALRICSNSQLSRNAVGRRVSASLSNSQLSPLSSCLSLSSLSSLSSTSCSRFFSIIGGGGGGGGGCCSAQSSRATTNALFGHQRPLVSSSSRRFFSRSHSSLLQQQQDSTDQQLQQEEDETTAAQTNNDDAAAAAVAAADAEFLAQLSNENIEHMAHEHLVQLLLKSRDKIAEKEAAQRDWQVKALDALAEMENIRRVSKRDIEHIQASQKLAFTKDFVNIVDKLEEATALLPESMIEQQEDLIQKDPDYKHPILLLQGLQMTNTELYKALSKHKIKATPERIGVEFDPRFHVVAGTVESATGPDGAPLPANSISSVLKKGYLLGGDQVIRQAMVIVVKPPSPPQEEPQAAGESQQTTEPPQPEK